MLQYNDSRILFQTKLQRCSQILNAKIVNEFSLSGKWAGRIKSLCYWLLFSFQVKQIKRIERSKWRQSPTATCLKTNSFLPYTKMQLQCVRGDLTELLQRANLYSTLKERSLAKFARVSKLSAVFFPVGKLEKSFRMVVTIYRLWKIFNQRAQLKKAMFLSRSLVTYFGKLFIVTHIVTATNSKGVCPRTIKYLNGVVTGKWIVNYDCKWIKMVEWVSRALSGKFRERRLFSKSFWNCPKILVVFRNHNKENMSSVFNGTSVESLGDSDGNKNGQKATV